MRAPPLSFRPITGAPTFIAMSMILTILRAWASLSVPPMTVKSCEEDVHQTAVDCAPAGYHAVARRAPVLHAKVRAAMFGESVQFTEAA